MTKTKKRNVVAGIAALSLACCVAGGIAVGGGIRWTARAANDFSADTEGSAVLPGGKSKDAIIAALNKKVQELNTAVEGVNADETKTLADAYAAGEIIAYSNRNNGIITQDNKRSGWKVWDGAAVLDLKYINAGYNGWGDNSVAWLSYDGISGNAYLITAEFANDYGNNGKKLGSAVSDMFRVENSEGEGYVTYQNFTGGYMKLEGNQITETYGKNIGTDGTETDANPRGYIGAAEENFVSGVSNETLYQVFVDAYDRYAQADYNVGYPFSAVQKENDLILQYFRNGDSVSDPWNDNARKNWAYLAYNAEAEEAYLITDEFAHVVEKNGDAKKIGSPVGDYFTVGGNRYQNFTKGYMKATGETARNTEATFVTGKNVNEDTGLEETLDEAGKIGKLSKAVTDKLPTGVTAAELSTAFKAAYEEKVEFASDEELQSVDLVTYENELLLQTYTDSKGAKHKLVYVEGKFIYLRPAVVSKMSGLGAPVAERIQVAQAETNDGEQTIYAYPFRNGYIKLTVSAQEKIQSGKPVTVTVENAVATSGATYDSEKKFFETTSFSDRITADTVSQSGLDQAYWSIWGVEKPTREAVAAAFKKAYDDAFALGFSAGEPSGEGIIWWTTGQSGIIKLTLKGGNGNGSFWNDNTLMSYNPYDGKAYITTGGIATKYADGGASGNGWATTEMKINTKTGVIVQQFDITDTDVTHRQVYIVVTDGKADKVDGLYDFEANKNGGEWVNYLSQFGGSISQKPITEATHRNEGEQVEINFASYITNKDGYNLTWNKVSGKGALSADGKYTLDAMTAEDDEVVVEVYSAFDKLTLRITFTTSEEGGSTTTDPSTDDTQKGDDEEDKGGCNSSVSVSLALVGGMLAVGAAAGGIAFKKRKK